MDPDLDTLAEMGLIGKGERTNDPTNIRSQTRGRRSSPST